MAIDVSRLVRAFIRIRQTQRDLTHRYETEMAVLDGQKDRVSAELLRFLNDTKQNGARTAEATFYKEQEMKPSAHDWAILYEWIRENDAFEALEKRIKKTFVKDYMEAHDGELPPGVTVHKRWVVKVRETDKEKDEQ